MKPRLDVRSVRVKIPLVSLRSVTTLCQRVPRCSIATRPRRPNGVRPQTSTPFGLVNATNGKRKAVREGFGRQQSGSGPLAHPKYRPDWKRCSPEMPAVVSRIWNHVTSEMPLRHIR